MNNENRENSNVNTEKVKNKTKLNFNFPHINRYFKIGIISIIVIIGIYFVLSFTMNFFYDDNNHKSEEVFNPNNYENSLEKKILFQSINDKNTSIQNIDIDPKQEIEIKLNDIENLVNLENDLSISKDQNELKEIIELREASDVQFNNENIERKKSNMIILDVTTAPTIIANAQDSIPLVEMQYIGDMSNILNKGKIIEAALETAINSDFGGEVYATITKDIYSANNKKILIPKGSKIFGEYVSGYTAPYARIAVIWNRINLPSGHIIKFQSISADNLGRKGTPGELDRKYGEKISNAVLISGMKILLAQGLDKLILPYAPDNNTSSVDSNIVVNNIKQKLRDLITDTSASISARIANVCGYLTDTSLQNNSNLTDIISVCNNNNLNNDEKLTNLIQATSKIEISNNAKDTSSRTYTSIKETYANLGELFQQIFLNENTLATVSVDQGDIIRIFVKNDYRFPNTNTNKINYIK